MGRQDPTAGGIEATTAQLQDRVRQAAAVFESTLPGADRYTSSASALFDATDELLDHEAQIPKLEAKARLSGRIRVGTFAGMAFTLWSAALIGTVPLGWTGGIWLLLLIPMLLVGAFVWIGVGGAKTEAEVRVEVGVPALAASALGSLLLLVHALSAWLLDLPVLALTGLGAWAFVLAGVEVSR
jgi:hypothetical protein